MEKINPLKSKGKGWVSSHLGRRWQQAVVEEHSEELPEGPELVVDQSVQEAPMSEPGGKFFILYIIFDINYCWTKQQQHPLSMKTSLI